MDKSINDAIDKTHFKTYKHVKKHVKNKHLNVSSKQIKDVIKQRLKDKFIKRKDIKPYMIKIFSNRPNTWFHDLYDNTAGRNPRYWHIFIGTNNRYVVVYPLNSKSAKDINYTLKQFINKYHPVKLTSDEEPGFLDKNNVKLLTDNNVSMHIITDKNHSSLGVIDRFIRTLRDMNTPNEKSKHQSHDEKYTYITPKRMNKFINTYNNSYHSAIGCSPNKMFKNIDLEKEYIFKCLTLAEKQQKIKDLIIPVGSYVRYILPRHDGIHKKRYQISRECYKIEDRRGNMYTLIAKDGTVITKPRYQLIIVNNKAEHKPKFANTIPGKWNGSVEKILSYDKNKNKYTVLFKVPNKKPYKDIIPASYLRGNTPQIISDIEKEYFKNK